VGVCVGVHPTHDDAVFFRDKAKKLLWSRHISTTKATRLAAELVQASSTLSGQPQTWVRETFHPLNLPTTTMAWHVLKYTAKSKVSSPVENCFNGWKKYAKSRLKRAALNQAFAHIMNQIEKRIIADSTHLTRHIAKGHFIDMRKNVCLTFDRTMHKKRRSTLFVFEKENKKTQDNECCDWSEAIPLGDKVWLLQQRVHKYNRDKVEDCTIVHVVSLKGFLWRDCPENVPPTCLTCPVFLNTKCPCVGIQRALLNVPPDVPDVTLPQWLSGSGIFRPEIFNNRLRIDKDPTIHLPDYLQCAAPQVRVDTRPSAAPSQAVVTEADIANTIKDLTSRIKKLSVTVQPKAHACFAQCLLEYDRRLKRFELDAQVAMTLQGRAQKSSIAHLHASAKGRQGPASKLAPDSRRSSVGRRHEEDAIIAVTIEAAVASSAASRRPAGTSYHIPLEKKWHCEYCNRWVTNTASSINQHCDGRKHIENVDEWPAGKALAPFHCSICSTDMENDAKLIRDHRRKCTAATDAPRIWHCEACNVDISADSTTVRDHTASLAHERQVRWAAEQNRDGQQLAKQTREANAAATAAQQGAAPKRTRRK